MRKLLSYGIPITASFLVHVPLAYFISTIASFTVRGVVLEEELFSEPDAEQVYRVVVRETPYRKTPYIFIGDTEELRRLDRQINVGDYVRIAPAGEAFGFSLEGVLSTVPPRMAFTINLEKVLSPKDIRKQ